MDVPFLSNNNQPESASDLRIKAESRFRSLSVAQQFVGINSIDANNIQQLIHELQVNQIELEIQNEELQRNQAELDLSRTSYFNLFDLAPVAYFTLNQQGLILDANLASANLLGLTCSREFYQTSITRYILKEDQDIYYINIRKITPRSPGAWEIRMVNLKGNPIWVQLNASAEYNHSQRTHVFHIAITDISEIKRHQQQLRLSDAALKSISQGVMMTTSDMSILSVNRSFTDITGYTLAEVIGQNYRFLQGPDTDPKTIEVMKAKITQGEEFSGEILNYRKDHTPFWNYLSITPLRNEAEVITHFMSIIHDVTPLST